MHLGDYDSDAWMATRCRHLHGDPDSWAYRQDFEKVCVDYRLATGDPATDRDIWRRYVFLRKQRKVLCKKSPDDPRLLPEFARCEPDKPVSHEEECVLIELYEAQSLSRQHLPYTTEFERMYAGFQARTRSDRSRANVYRRLEYLGKAGKLPRKDTQPVEPTIFE
jgi:hypothetical protein